MKLSVGQLFQVYLARAGKTQSDLAKACGCSRAFVNMVAHDRKRPGRELAIRMAHTLVDEPIEQEGLVFFLLGYHKQVTKLLEEYPNAFEDFRTTGDRQDDKSLRIC
jgi:transcriptional regulator with XRE-family HTH domain